MCFRGMGAATCTCASHQGVACGHRSWWMPSRVLSQDCRISNNEASSTTGSYQFCTG